MSSIKSVKYSNEPVFVNSDGTLEPYIHHDIITHRDAYAKSLHILFKHVGDFHAIVVEILAEKLGLDSEEIIKQIQQDARYKEMVVSPVIHSLGSFEKSDIEKIIPVDEVAVLSEKMSEMEVKKKRKYVRKTNA